MPFHDYIFSEHKLIICNKSCLFDSMLKVNDVPLSL